MGGHQLVTDEELKKVLAENQHLTAGEIIELTGWPLSKPRVRHYRRKFDLEYREPEPELGPIGGLSDMEFWGAVEEQQRVRDADRRMIRIGSRARTIGLKPFMYDPDRKKI